MEAEKNTRADSDKKQLALKQLVSQNSIWLALIVMVLLVSILRPQFFTSDNLFTLLQGESIKGVMAFGVMFAILSKGIDLSMGSIVALVAVICASFAQNADAANRLLGGFGPLPAPVIWLIGIAIGLIIGCVIGALIAYTKIPAFIATLGAQLICRALSKMYSTQPVSNLSPSFRVIGRGNTIIIIFVIFFIIGAFLLTQTRFGKNIYAIGGNDQAAQVAGINVEKNIIKLYAWCSMCAAVGGILLAARTGSADPSTYGLNYELDAIAAATIGGTSHSGGICRVTGVLAGILIMGVINNGLVILGVDDNMTNVIKGLIIVGAVIFDMRKNVKRA